MKLDLNPLLKRETEEISFRFSYEESSADVYGDPVFFETPIHVQGKAKRIGEQLYLETLIQIRIRTKCARCLVDVEDNLTAEIFEEMVPFKQDQEEEENTFYYSSKEIDLLIYAKEQVMVHLPIKTLCREDCAGICRSCGTNLNEGTCECASTESPDQDGDPRFAQLRDWLKNANE